MASSGSSHTPAASSTPDAAPLTRRQRRAESQKQATRHRVSAIGVLGDLLLTAGAVVMLFVVWQVWIGDIIIGSASDREAAALSEEWSALPPAELPPTQTATPDDEAAEGEDPAPVVYEPVVPAHPAAGEPVAALYIPRFGEDFVRTIAGGTRRSVTLDRGYVGIDEKSSMPGEAGNFFLAAHRNTAGGAFSDIDSLRLGDAIVVETPDGWFTYRFRTHEYVTPREVGVLLDVPQMPDVHTGEQFISLMSCFPRYSIAERVIAYGVFESFQPRALGAPASLTEAGS